MLFFDSQCRSCNNCGLLHGGSLQNTRATLLLIPVVFTGTVIRDKSFYIRFMGNLFLFFILLKVKRIILYFIFVTNI